MCEMCGFDTMMCPEPIKSSEAGAATLLAKKQEGEQMDYPESYEFETVNDFVHDPDRHFEELQNVCIGAAGEVTKLTAQRDAWKKAAIYCMAQIDEDSPAIELANKRFKEALNAELPKAG